MCKWHNLISQMGQFKWLPNNSKAPTWQTSGLDHESIESFRVSMPKVAHAWGCGTKWCPRTLMRLKGLASPIPWAAAFTHHRGILLPQLIVFLNREMQSAHWEETSTHTRAPRVLTVTSQLAGLMAWRARRGPRCDSRGERSTKPARQVKSCKTDLTGFKDLEVNLRLSHSPCWSWAAGCPRQGCWSPLAPPPRWTGVRKGSAGCRAWRATAVPVAASPQGSWLWAAGRWATRQGLPAQGEKDAPEHWNTVIPLAQCVHRGKNQTGKLYRSTFSKISHHFPELRTSELKKKIIPPLNHDQEKLKK